MTTVYQNVLGRESCVISEDEDGYTFLLSTDCDLITAHPHGEHIRVHIQWHTMDGPLNIAGLVESMCRELQDHIAEQLEVAPDA